MFSADITVLEDFHSRERGEKRQKVYANERLLETLILYNSAPGRAGRKRVRYTFERVVRALSIRKSELQSARLSIRFASLRLSIHRSGGERAKAWPRKLEPSGRECGAELLTLGGLKFQKCSD